MRPISKTYTAVAQANAPIPLDLYVPNCAVSIQVDVTGTVNYDVQYTVDNIWDPTVTPVWNSFPVAALVGATADQVGSSNIPMTAVRYKQNSGAGTARMTVIQQSTQ